MFSNIILSMNRLPDFPALAHIGFEHLAEISKALEALQPELSTVSTGNIFGYRKETGLLGTRINGNICFSGFYKGVHFFSQPLGNNKLSETVATGLAFLKEKFGGGRVSNLPKAMAEILSADKKFIVSPDRNNFDYVYATKELADLPGEKFHDKKNLVNQFNKKYPHAYAPLSPENIKHCLELEEEWCRLRNCLEYESTAAESACINELLLNFEKLKLCGGVILISGKIQAFTILQKLNNETAVTHVEKANTEFKGIYQAVNNYAAKSLLGRFKYINREEDLGEPGLRKAKMSYNPVKFVEKFHVELSS